MNESILKIYQPMTESAFYILFCLQNEMHGYQVGQQISDMTLGELSIGPGTMYGTLSKMTKDGLIKQTKIEDNRKYYQITPDGQFILDLEVKRIERLYKNSRGVKQNG